MEQLQMTKRILEAKQAHDEAVGAMEEYGKVIDGLAPETKDDEREFHDEEFRKLEEAAERAAEKLEREVSFQKSRQASAFVLKDAGVKVGKEPLTYEAHSRHSYFRDLISTQIPGLGWGSPDAAERLARHAKEMSVEKRDVTSADPGTGTFIPPLYLGERWIDEEVAGRPFANAVAKMPLPSTGKQLDFPRVQTAPAVGVQAAEANAVLEVDFDGETYSVPKVTIAGQNDLSIQAYEFADPGMDVVIMRELVKSYNSVLDTQLISGSGGSGQHRGIKNVASINSITFSGVGAAGGGDALLGAIYDAASQIATNAPGYVGNAILMHPRRAAWLASHRDSNGSLLQQGGYVFASGSQDNAFALTAAGLGVVSDPNITVVQGAGTNEDEVFVVALDELILAEGDLRTRVLSEVLSGTLQVRLQVYAFSAFAGGRRPKVITRISGAGLIPPTFPST